MKPVVIFTFKIWLFSFLFAPAITLLFTYLKDKRMIGDKDDFIELFLLLTFICGIAVLILLPIFFLALLQIKKYQGSWLIRMALFMIIAFLTITISLRALSIIERQDWGLAYFGITGWIIQAGYLFTWLITCLLFRKFFLKVEKTKRQNFGTLDEIE
ncbi:MAG TPA: hypothetical protein PLD84_04835 [Chitinophagales bacterium]|nr:hypothetical protein [Chitinophagales bacterium]